MNYPHEIIAAYNTLLAEIEPLLFIVRDSGLQRAGIEALDAFTSRVDQSRLSAILEKDEEQANLLLGFRSAARALAGELSMHILLKEDRPEAAWNALIGAQGELGAAARAHPSFNHLGPKAGHLRELETRFFPPQVFLSAGAIVREQQCSICNGDYEKCDHIAGRPYMGRFCTIVLKKVSLNHVAVVDDPADRLCRVTAFKVPGGTRNRMTWVVTPGEGSENGTGTVEAIIATTGAVDADPSGDPHSSR